MLYKKYQAILKITRVFYLTNFQCVPTIKLLGCYVMPLCANNLIF